MKFKNLIKRLFSEMYRFHEENWGEGDLPGLTALLWLSLLQLLNIGSVLAVIQIITSVDLFGYFSKNLMIWIIIPVVILIMDYLIVKPIKITIKENPPKRRTITWIYVLSTILFLAGCLVWIAIINNNKGI